MIKCVILKGEYIYDVKQSSRSWYFGFHEAITSVSLSMCVCKKIEEGLMFLSLYVSDIYFG